MFFKPEMLIVVFAIFVAALWVSVATRGRATHTDKSSALAEAQRRVTGPDAAGDAIRQLHRESGSY